MFAAEYRYFLKQRSPSGTLPATLTREGTDLIRAAVPKLVRPLMIVRLSQEKSAFLRVLPDGAYTNLIKPISQGV
jgi:hypothetical protein